MGVVGHVRLGFRAQHNYAARPSRKAAGVFLRSENAEAGPRKTVMRFMRGKDTPWTRSRSGFALTQAHPCEKARRPHALAVPPQKLTRIIFLTQ